MFHRLFLIVALLTTCTVLGVSSLHAPSEKVQAFAGDHVILPCSFNFTAGDDFPTVEWSKRDLKPENIVYLQRDGFEIHAMKNPAFEYRTSLIQRELQKGNVSLRISSVQLSDAGVYQCMRLWSKARRDITTVELVVGAVSEPKLSVISAESGGVTVQCVAECWLPLPDIKFLDDQGNDISAHEPRSDPDATGCYTVRRRVTLQGTTKRIKCRVHQSEINQTKETDILIPRGEPGGRRSCFPTARVAVPGFAVLLFCGVLVFFSYKKCGKSAGKQKMPLNRQPSDQSTVSCTSENQPILGSFVAQNEKLRKQVVELRSKVLERDKAILQLQSGTESKLSPVVSQLDQPTMVHRPSNPPKAPNIPKEQHRKPPAISRQNSLESAKRPSQRSRVRSCPDVLDFTPESSSSTTARTSKKKPFGRSLSDACAQSGPSVPKDQRRRSSPVFPSSTPITNPFSPWKACQKSRSS